MNHDNNIKTAAFYFGPVVSCHMGVEGQRGGAAANSCSRKLLSFFFKSL